MHVAIMLHAKLIIMRMYGSCRDDLHVYSTSNSELSRHEFLGNEKGGTCYVPSKKPPKFDLLYPATVHT